MKQCTRCHQEKAGGEFHRDRSKTGGLASRCKECCKVEYLKDRERRIAHHHQWYLKNQSEQQRKDRERNRHKYAATPEAILEKNRRYYLTHRAERLEYMRRYGKAYNEKLRDNAIKAYGGYSCSCPGCEVTIPEFLAIDHIDGGGGKHRKQIRGTSMYLWLAKNNYPTGFRVLCHNCNMARGFYGYCPHDRS